MVQSSIPFDIPCSIINIKNSNAIDLVEDSSECENISNVKQNNNMDFVADSLECDKKESSYSTVRNGNACYVVPAKSIELKCLNEESGDNASLVNEYDVSSHKQSNVNRVVNTATVITESVIPNTSRNDEPSCKELFD